MLHPRPKPPLERTTQTAEPTPALLRLGSLAVALALVALACSGDGGTGPGDDGTTRTMRATINGAAWSADSVGMSIGTDAAGNPQLSLGGLNRTTLRALGFDLRLKDPPPGTYTVAEGRIHFVGGMIDGSELWLASDPSLGGSGTVVLSTYTASRIAGSFSFNALPVPGTAATGALTVTSGTFNVSY